MKNKLVHGLLIVLGAAVMLMMAFPFGMLLSLAFWVYLWVLLRKDKPVFHEDHEPQSVKKVLKRLRSMAIAAGIAFIIAIAGIVMHNVQSGIAEQEEVLYFYIGLIALYIFILLSVAGFVLFQNARQKPLQKK